VKDRKKVPIQDCGRYPLHFAEEERVERKGKRKNREEIGEKKKRISRKFLRREERINCTKRGDERKNKYI